MYILNLSTLAEEDTKSFFKKSLKDLIQSFPSSRPIVITKVIELSLS